MLAEREVRNESALEGLFASLFLGSDWRDYLVMPLAAYFDAAGHEADQKFVVVAGFVATPAMWTDFDRDWKARLAKDDVEFFHAVEFAQSTGQFKGWRDEKEKRQALSNDLMEILKRNVSRKFVCAVSVESLRADMSEDIKAAFLINAYSLAGRTCAARLRQWQDREQWKTVPELIFEEGDIGKGMLRDSLVRDGFGEPLFRPKKDTPTADGLIIPGLTPLQAADWLAYEFFLSVRDQRMNRWPLNEFLNTHGPMGVYLAKDIQRLEALANAAVDDLIRADVWRDIGDELRE